MVNLLKRFQKQFPDISLTPAQRTLFRKLKFAKKDKDIFLIAITHPSFTAENDGESYQRLEFLGDAVLGLYTAENLFNKRTGWDEGKMTRARASMVSKNALADSARRLSIGECMRLGSGEESTGGRDRDSNLCDMFESVIGALFLSRGFKIVKYMITKLDLLLEANISEDPKSKLQRISAEKKLGYPNYKIISEKIDGSNTSFDAKVSIGKRSFFGSGESKKSAEMEAAKDALREILKVK